MRFSRRTFTALLPAAALSSRFLRAAETPEAWKTTGGRFSGIREVVFSTFDIQRIARPFIDTARFRFTALPDAPREQYSQWRVPAACTRIEQALLVPPDSSTGRGALRLVKFHGVDQKVMRSSQRSWDTGGIFDIDVYSTDLEGVYRSLQRHGWTALGEPVDYSESAFNVKEVVAVGPDGLLVAIIQRYSPPVADQPANQPMSPIFNSSQIVVSLDRALDFYTKTLGWETQLNFNVTDKVEPGADVLGLPLPQARTAIRRVAIVQPAGQLASVELIENASMHGHDFSTNCLAPNVGILCLRIPVPDARKYAAEIARRGGQLFASPAKIEIAPYGPATIFAVQSPDGAIIEFFDGPFEGAPY